MKLRVGDEVLVTAGKDKGRQGKIEKVFPKQKKVLIPQVNVYKKHQKGVGDQKGGIIEFSRPLSTGNIALICPNCGKQTRIAYFVSKGNDKSRICVKCKKTLNAGSDLKKQ